MCRAHEIWQVKRTHTATLETTGLCRQTQGSGGDRAAPRNSKSRGSLRDGSQLIHFHQDEFTGTVGKKGMSPGGEGRAGCCSRDREAGNSTWGAEGTAGL